MVSYALQVPEILGSTLLIDTTNFCDTSREVALHIEANIVLQ